MHVIRSKFKGASGKNYETVLLRESYRDGKKVKKRTVANLTHCSEDEIVAIELALKHKANLKEMISQGPCSTKEGLSVGGVWVIYQMAQRLGIVDALSNSKNGQLALWQVIARVLEQGSRLSSVRLSETYAIASVIDLKEGFNEETLYKNLLWLSQNQAKIENELFSKKLSSGISPNLFLYDVTSSYLEGDKNELADWGYNRDKKRGKKQIVIGLLSDEDGVPISTEVFKGNTQDTATFASQIQKAKERFRCERVTFVGDRGMIKSGQIEDLQAVGFHYITASTKAQIETLLKNGTIQMSLFDNTVTEVQENNVRYIFRRNPVRAQEIACSRDSKLSSIEKLTAKQNVYLIEHPKAQLKTALKTIEKKIAKLGLKGWLTVCAQERVLSLHVDEEKKSEEGKLDGCYVLRTDLTGEEASFKTVHDRYKDLAMVESSFRTEKSNLELRPVYVRKEENTRGHVLVVMLAYMIMKALDNAWKHLYLTVEEGIRSLSTLTILETTFDNGSAFQYIPEPRKQNQLMLEALDIRLPKILPKNNALVVTRQPRRKQT
jgi:transposase